MYLRQGALAITNSSQVNVSDMEYTWGSLVIVDPSTRLTILPVSTYSQDPCRT